MERILIVEDDRDVRKVLKNYLSVEDLDIDEASNIQELREALSRKDYDVVLLDIMLPDGFATEEIPRMRAKSKDIGIIVISARDADMDRIFGIELGADDYIVKPFNPREVVARVKALLRRMKGHRRNLSFGKLEIYPDDFVVILDGERVELSTMEFKVLKLLASNPKKVFTREEILNMVWGDEEFISDRVVDVHVSNIRNKLGRRWIKTVRGVGYKFGGERNDGNYR